MTITENPELSKLLMSALIETFRETRGRNGDESIHLSDLLYPRKAFWGRTTETLPSETEVLYWAAGRAHEDILARLAGMVAKDPPVVASVPGLVVGEHRERMGISYRPDFRWGITSHLNPLVPAEFKTSRYAPPLPGEESFKFETYLEQLRGYCLLDEVNHGKLIVFFLHAPALVVYDVDFTDSEIARMGEELRDRLVAEKKALKKWAAYRSKTDGASASVGTKLAGERPTKQWPADASGGKSDQPMFHQELPLCPPGFCGTAKKYEISPARCIDCDTEMTVKRAARHVTTKKGKSHIVTAPITGWWYKPKCKWYSDCKPWEKDPVRKQW